MHYLLERVAYLRGLADGLGIDSSTKEGELLLAIIEVLDDMADSINYIEEESFNLHAEFSEDGGNVYICPNCNAPIEIDENLIGDDTRMVCPKCKDTIIVLMEDL